MGGGAESVLNLEVDASIPTFHDPSFGAHEDLFLVEIDDSLVPHFLDGRDFLVPGLSSEGRSLLMKYTRRIQPSADAAPVFSARVSEIIPWLFKNPSLRISLTRTSLSSYI